MIFDSLLVGFSVIAVFWSLLWILSLVINDASIADVGWGLSAAVTSIVLLIVFSPLSAISTVISLMVTIWGFRLALHIGSRKIGRPEDWRYQNWRREWGTSFKFTSLYRIFLLQGALSLVMVMPLVVLAGQTYDMPLNPLVIIGTLIWLAGFAIEVISDIQLRKFIATRKGPKQIMSSGLWRYSRHPNYFGEVVSWWGIWIAVASFSYGWIAMSSPVLITYLVLFVSGVPLLEQKYKNLAAYQEYARRTSSFILLPIKRSKS